MLKNLQYFQPRRMPLADIDLSGPDLGSDADLHDHEDEDFEEGLEPSLYDPMIQRAVTPPPKDKESSPGQSGNTGAPPALTMEQLSQIAGILRPAQPQQQQQAPQPQISSADLAKQLKRFDVTPSLRQRIVDNEDPDDATAALQEVLNGVYTHMYTVLTNYGDKLQNQFEQQLSPVQQMQTERQEQMFVSQLEDSYPGLKGRSKLVQTALRQVQASGWQPNPHNPFEAYQYVASHAEELAKQIDPNFSAQGAASGQRQTQQQTMPQMAHLPSGGGAGGAGGAANGSPSNSLSGNKHWKRIGLFD